MQRDSFIFYRSFYEAINDLPDKEQLKVYKAICEMSLNFEEIDLKGLSNTIFKLIKPQLEANNTRFKNGLKGKEFGVLGGRPKKPQDKPQKNPKLTPNNNVNVNVNENNNNNIYTFIENEYGRTLSSTEYLKIEEWLSWFNLDIIKYAFEVSVLNNKRQFNYVNGILTNWKSCNYKTLQEIKNNETKDKNEQNYKVISGGAIQLC